MTNNSTAEGAQGASNAPLGKLEGIVAGHAARDVWQADILTDKSLTPSALRVGSRLALHLNCTTGRCDPTHATLATELGISEKSVKRGVLLLEERGWIAVHRNAGGNHSNTNKIALLVQARRGTFNGASTGDILSTSARTDKNLQLLTGDISPSLTGDIVRPTGDICCPPINTVEVTRKEESKKEESKSAKAATPPLSPAEHNFSTSWLRERELSKYHRDMDEPTRRCGWFKSLKRNYPASMIGDEVEALAALGRALDAGQHIASIHKRISAFVNRAIDGEHIPTLSMILASPDLRPLPRALPN